MDFEERIEIDAEREQQKCQRHPRESRVAKFQKEVDAELAGIGREWDLALDAGADEGKKQALLARMNEVLNHRSYIRNLVAGVQKELAEA